MNRNFPRLLDGLLNDRHAHPPRSCLRVSIRYGCLDTVTCDDHYRVEVDIIDHPPHTLLHRLRFSSKLHVCRPECQRHMPPPAHQVRPAQVLRHPDDSTGIVALLYRAFSADIRLHYIIAQHVRHPTETITLGLRCFGPRPCFHRHGDILRAPFALDLVEALFAAAAEITCSPVRHLGDSPRLVTPCRGALRPWHCPSGRLLRRSASLADVRLCRRSGLDTICAASTRSPADREDPLRRTVVVEGAAVSRTLAVHSVAEAGLWVKVPFREPVLKRPDVHGWLFRLHR